MADQSWDRITDAIDIKFGLTDHGHYSEPLADRTDLSQQVSFVTFNQNGESFRLERRVGPAIIDRKTIHHKAAGSSVRYENVYDESETSQKIHLLKRGGDDNWIEVDPTELAIG